MLKNSMRATLAAVILWSGGVALIPAGATAQLPSFQTAQTPVSLKVVYVNPSKGKDAAGVGSSEVSPYRTISYALQQAQAGTVIQLAPGKYNQQSGEVFPLEIKPGVTLRGNLGTKGQGIVIEGGGTYVSRTFASQNVTIYAAEDSKIEGVTVTNPNTRGTGLWVESTNPVVQHSTFTNSLRDGIFVTGTGAPRIENNVFIGNSANGISLVRDAGGVIRGNLFEATGFGIAVGDRANTFIEDNTIVKNIDGIVASNQAQPVLRGNTIENNQRNGVVAIASAKPNLGTASTPGNNRIRNNGELDLYNATSGQTISAISNDIDAKKITGAVDFQYASIQYAFNDVGGNWAASYITALAKKGIIAGFPDGTFRPDEPVTRAQFAAIVSKAFVPAAQRDGISFGDVTSSFWGSAAIQSAYRGGFLVGYPGNVFRPNQEIPKVQAIVALTSGLGLRSDDTTILSRYQDAAQIPDYAVTAIAGATRNQLVVNYPQLDAFNPNRTATRAEVAAFVYQALVNAGKAEPITSPYLVAMPQ
jgi:parallel beta-helix repeat protein